MEKDENNVEVNKKISVVITTYKEPSYLDLCIKSCLQNQVNSNEVVVVIDGTLDYNQHIVEKYKGKVVFVVLKNNLGMSKSQNIGVYKCTYNRVVICNDDHVFPSKWDKNAETKYDFNTVTSFSTIERFDNRTKYVNVRNFGDSPENFNMAEFLKFKNVCQIDVQDYGYVIYPFMINKWKYISLGGFDENYLNGVVADYDLFLKAKIMGMKFNTCFENSFYHFGSVSANDSVLLRDNRIGRVQSDILGHRYAVSKFGTNIKSKNCKHYIFSDDDRIEFEKMK